jgi:O-antigen/teichoic acid export membrane protein
MQERLNNQDEGFDGSTENQMEGAAPPVKRRSVGRNIGWYLAGNVAFSAGQWAMLVLLAKLSGPELVGLMTIARAITFPPLQFANLNLRTVLASTTSDEFTFRDFFGLRLVALPLAFLFIVGVALLGYPPYNAAIIILVAVAGVFDSVSDVIYGVFQQTENLDRISISRSIQGFGQLAAFVAVMALTRNLLFGVASLAIVSAIVTFAYDLRFAKITLHQARREKDKRFTSETSLSLKPNFDLAILMRLFKHALPMALVLLFIALNFNVPRYFVEYHLGLKMLGIFGAMTALMQAAAMVQSAVGHSTVPRLARYFDEAPKLYVRLFRKLILIAMCSTLGNIAISLVAGRWLLAVIYKPEFAKEYQAFHWLMVANGIFYLQAALRDAATAAKNYRVQPWIHGIGVLVIALASSILVPSYGLIGASWAVCLGMLVLVIGFAVVMRQTIRNLSPGE